MLTRLDGFPGKKLRLGGRFNGFLGRHRAFLLLPVVVEQETRSKNDTGLADGFCVLTQTVSSREE